MVMRHIRGEVGVDGLEVVQGHKRGWRQGLEEENTQEGTCSTVIVDEMKAQSSHSFTNPNLKAWVGTYTTCDLGSSNLVNLCKND